MMSSMRLRRPGLVSGLHGESSRDSVDGMTEGKYMHDGYLQLPCDLKTRTLS